MACRSVLSSSPHITNSMAIKEGVLSFAPNPPLLLRLPKAVTFLSFSASTKPPTKSFQGFQTFLFCFWDFFFIYTFWIFVIPVICSVSCVHIGGIATCCCWRVTLVEPNPVTLFCFLVCPVLNLICYPFCWSS